MTDDKQNGVCGVTIPTTFAADARRDGFLVWYGDFRAGADTQFLAHAGEGAADPWHARLSVWLHSSHRVQGTQLTARETMRFTKRQLLSEALGLPVGQMDPARTRLMAVRVGAVMQRLGWSYERDPQRPQAWHFRRPADRPAQEACDA